MAPTALRGVVLTCLLKFLNKFVEILFSTQSPTRFYLTNTTVNGSRDYCTFDTSIQPEHPQSPMSTATSWLFSARYTLPVLGGLMSSAWLGYVRVLQIGGVIMLLANVLLLVSVQLGFMCQPSPIIPVTWLLVPLFIGLIQPNIMYGMFRWHKFGKPCTIVAALYVVWASLGEWVELLMSYFDVLGSRLTVIFLPASVLFVVLTFLLPPESDEPFEMPTLQRMRKYFIIFSGLILFLIPAVNDTRPMVYISAMRHYLKGTEYLDTHFWLSPDLPMFFIMMVFSALMMLAASQSPRDLPLQFRMQAGILLECAVCLSLVVFTLFGDAYPVAAIAAYTGASMLGGIAVALVLLTELDLANRIAPPNSKAIVMSIMFTVLGLSYLASCVLAQLLENFPGDKFLSDEEFHKFLLIYHLISMLALIVCSIYHRFVAFPLVSQLIPSDDDSVTETDTEGERTPLLNPTDA